MSATTSTGTDLCQYAMGRLDGCPECVLNVELPLSYVAVYGAVMTAYLCHDCGHAWTTDWATTVPTATRETWDNKASPNGASTPPGSDRPTRVSEQEGWTSV